MRDWARKIVEGDVRALARAATAIENRTAEARALERELAAEGGHATVIGITGPPGAGKSTLVDALARALRAENRTIGILAVDPTSIKTGGAILGDRIRMQGHHADPGIFIRSMATRGAVGGLARATAGLVRLLDAAGKDYVLIETVGVGQDEVEIARLAQITVLVLVPGMGDDVQAIKAGLLEVADIFVINKADHAGADRIERELQESGWVRPIVRTVATEGRGIAELLAAIRSLGKRPALGAAPGKWSLDHLGIAVKSLDDALKFYEGQLGMTAMARETVAQEQVNVAMLPLDGPRIELLEAAGPDSAIAKFIAKRGEGLHHVALKVPDLEGVIQKLKAAGARLLNEPRAGAGGQVYVFVHPGSAGGVLLELIQE
ncbi:MAG TPA: methylmalonyl Co-A mutase-associated GTPase MeaB [Bryobacteraceae bacterium]|nr:methylmalonyl Co-A mutase-associated GTPase MeaB [Bryobacteraceae bacterium]